MCSLGISLQVRTSGGNNSDDGAGAAASSSLSEELKKIVLYIYERVNCLFMIFFSTILQYRSINSEYVSSSSIFLLHRGCEFATICPCFGQIVLGLVRIGKKIRSNKLMGRRKVQTGKEELWK